MLWVCMRVISCVSNKAGLLVFAAAVGVVAEHSQGEFTVVFEKGEVKGKGMPKLYCEAVVCDAFDSKGFGGFGHWVEALLNKGFLAECTFFLQPVLASANFSLSTENSDRVSRQN